MKSKLPFFLVFLIAVLVRADLNFSIPLVPGLGGGYNLVQIRAVVENGHLGLPDMPLLFYLNAWIVKIILFLFPVSDVGQSVIIVSKIIDTIGFPIILYPLYLIQKDMIRRKVPFLYLFAVAAFAVLSYAPLNIASDAQKNSMGLVFMTFFIYFFLRFLKFRTNKDIVFSALMLMLTALTHFGVFCITLSFLMIAWVVFFRWKALLPMIGTIVAGMLLIAVFDRSRALSMLTFWQEAFSIFLSPRLMYYPFGVFNFIFSLLLAWFIIRVLRRRRAEVQKDERKLLLVLLIFLILLAFPFYGFEYGRRLGLMSFLPQSLALLYLYPTFSKRAAAGISYAVIVLVALTVAWCLLFPRPMAITDASYADMKNLKSRIDDPERTIIFARHGLEWWVAWELRVNIASASTVVDDAMKHKYDQIFFLVQKRGENLIYPGKTSIFIQPQPPDHSMLVYDSGFFDMYELKMNE